MQRVATLTPIEAGVNSKETKATQNLVILVFGGDSITGVQDLHLVLSGEAATYSLKNYLQCHRASNLQCRRASNLQCPRSGAGAKAFLDKNSSETYYVMRNY